MAGRPDTAAAAEKPTRRLESAALQLVYLLGLAAVVAGLYVLRDSNIGADAGHALSAVASQLPVTLAPAIIILALTALSIAAGAVLVRAVAGAPFGGFAQAAL